MLRFIINNSGIQWNKFIIRFSLKSKEKNRAKIRRINKKKEKKIKIFSYFRNILLYVWIFICILS